MHEPVMVDVKGLEGRRFNSDAHARVANDQQKSAVHILTDA